jgi:hypothetical protein
VPIDDIGDGDALKAPLCGEPATTTRVVEGLVCPLCAAHAKEFDEDED